MTATSGAALVITEEDSGFDSLSSCNEQQMENYVTLFIVVLNRKGEFVDGGDEEVLQQLRLIFDSTQTVWKCKQRILANLLEHTVRDPLNYGLYCPAANGRAGKFLDEERLLKEYGLSSPAMLEFKYKRRVYKMMTINQRKLRQLHSKSTLRQFLDYVKHNNVERVSRLLVSGLDPNFCDPESGDTPLSLSVSLPKPYDMICALFNGGAHVDFRGAGGITPVHKAARSGSSVAMKSLLELGAAANYRDERGLTPLYHAVSHSRADFNCVDMLLRDRAQLNVLDEQQNTEIHQAARGGHSAIVEHLLYYGSIADSQNAIGNSALHLAAIEGHEAVVRVLLFRGAKKDLRNSAQNSPYEVAVLAGHVEIAKIIAAHTPSQVVPYRDAPVYTQRRHMATPARMPLSRSSSDNRLAASFALANGQTMASAALQQGKRAFFQAAMTCGASSVVDGVANSGNNSTGEYASSSSPSNAGGGIYYATRLGPAGELAISGGSISGFSTNHQVDMNASATADFAGAVVQPAVFTASPISHRSVAEYSSRSIQSGTATLPLSLVRAASSVSGAPPPPMFVTQHRRVAHCVKSYKTKSPFELPLKKVLGPGEEGMFEGQDVESGRRGYFPSRCVREVGSLGSNSGANFLEATFAIANSEGCAYDFQQHSAIAMRQRSRSAATLYADDAASISRTVVIQRTPAGFGFVLKGPRASHPGQTEIEFIPSPSMPATQYLAVVESGSVADRAGLKPKDYVLEIDGISVVSATHERCVDLIRSSTDMLQLKVVTIPPSLPPGQTADSERDGHRPPRPWRHHAPPGSSGAMTLSRHSHQRQANVGVEHLEMSLRSQLTLPRQPKLSGLRNSIGGNQQQGDMTIQSLNRRSVPPPVPPCVDTTEGESDYETIDDAGNQAPLPVPNVSMIPNTNATMANVSDNDEATYSSQLEQMDSGNSSCSNHNDEVTSAGTLYANAGQLRRLYGVDASTTSSNDDKILQYGNEDANYDTLADDPPPPAPVETNEEINEEIYENDASPPVEEVKVKRSASVKPSLSFSARAEETRRAFLTQLQRSNKPPLAPPPPPPPPPGPSQTTTKRQEAVFIAEF